MRTYVRAWINAWDVRRIYHIAADQNGYEIDAVKEDYQENPELEPEDGAAPSDNA